MNTRTTLLRRMVRVLGRALLWLLTRTTVTGREHLAVEGPVIYAANHASTFDALLILVLLPLDTVFVGPGDFKLLWPASSVIDHIGLIPMKRGAVDRDGLRRMVEVLKAGRRLCLFPEGGTWEKPIDEVKSGATYLSHAARARIVPMGYGGTYQVWARMFRLRRPRITVRIGPPLPPVTLSGDRKRRQDELQGAAVDLMHRIYDLLPPDTQARYDRLARQRFAGTLVFDPATIQPPDVSFDALAELISKPNLFSPLHRNARLPLKPFVRHSRYYPARTMKTAVDALLGAFAEGDYAGYLEYRLGDDKAGQVRAALAAISAAVDAADAAGARAAFFPTVIEQADRLGAGGLHR
ncbi:MAG: 1-acyl-sn-glycerol-3-phosphate acyltransferase [Anaerolineae bacterium]|nr:1-acyl-sn-glycerol-3-phosphate acyltransferase [Anaerolineae bacterium]